MQPGGSITLEDGAQLKATNSVPVNVQKGTSAGIWQAIAPPVGLKCGIANAKNLTSSDYDLMRYDEASATWQNQKAGDDAEGFDTLESGRGYIYRRADSRDLAYHGNTVVGNVPFALSSSCADNGLAGFNLVGNPYTHNVNLNRAYYTLAADGTWQAHPDGGTLLVGQAALVHAAYNGETLTFTPFGSTPGAKGQLPPLPKALILNENDNDNQNDNSQLSIVNSQFAHISGDHIIIEGTGLLSVFDIMGRLLFNFEIQNSKFEIQNSAFPATGIYILRLGEKSQKIVIK